MARAPRDSRIETREARRKLLVASTPYWRSISPGVFIGYRKGPTGGIWWARVLPASFGGKGNYRKRSLGPADDHADAGAGILNYRQALDAAQAFAEELARVGGDLVSGGYTVAHAVKDYMDNHYKKNGRAQSQINSTVSCHILPYWGEKVITEIKAKNINDWMNKLATAPKNQRGQMVEVDPNDAEALRKRKNRANRILNDFKAILNHAFRHGHVHDDLAWRRVTKFKGVDEANIKFLTLDEAVRLINAAHADFRDLVRAAIQTGCRYGELASLRVSDYNTSNGTLFIRRSKSSKQRLVALSEEGAGWFSSWTTGRARDELIFLNNSNPWGKSHQTRPDRWRQPASPRE
jgi:site-specific recombinase XerD